MIILIILCLLLILAISWLVWANKQLKKAIEQFKAAIDLQDQVIENKNITIRAYRDKIEKSQ